MFPFHQSFKFLNEVLFYFVDLTFDLVQIVQLRVGGDLVLIDRALNASEPLQHVGVDLGLKHVELLADVGQVVADDFLLTVGPAHQRPGASCGIDEIVHLIGLLLENQLLATLRISSSVYRVTYPIEHSRQNRPDEQLNDAVGIHLNVPGIHAEL